MNSESTENFRSAIVVTVGGLGARWIEPWGSGSVSTPVINGLAVEGVLVETAYALRAEIREQAKAWFDRPGQSGTNWIRELADAGFTTILLTDCSKVAAVGEEFFSDVIELESLSECDPADDLAGTQMAGFFAGARELMQTVPAERSLVWLHTQGLELPWDAPYEMRMAVKGDEDPDPPGETIAPEIRLQPDDVESHDLVTGWQEAYAAQIHVLDWALGLLIGSVDDPDQESRPMVCLAGTGGYAFGEHGRIGRRSSGCLFDEYLHVPIVLRFPDDEQQSVRLMQLEPLDSLAPIIEAWMLGGAAMGILHDLPLPDRERNMLWCKTETASMLRTHAWKLICSETETQLFLKPDDRWEQNNVTDRCARIAAELDSLLKQLPDECRGVSPEEFLPLDRLLTHGLD